MENENENFCHSEKVSSRIVSNISELRNKFCDVRFTIGESVISAHRVILAAAMPIFQTVFSDEHESNSGKKFDVHFPLVDNDAFMSLINFAYTSKIKISVDNVDALLTAAVFLEFHEVRDACCSFLLNRLNPANALKMYNVAKRSCCNELSEQIETYVAEHFKQVALSEDFVKVSPDFLIAILSRDDLRVENEKEVFEIVMNWFKVCPAERRGALSKMIKYIRFDFLHSGNPKIKSLKNIMSCLVDIDAEDIMKEILFINICDSGENIPRKPKKSISNVDAIPKTFSSSIYALQSAINHVVQVYNPLNDKWQTTFKCSFEMWFHHSFAEMHGKFYCFHPSMTYVCNVKKQGFEFCDGMSTPRLWTGAGSLGEKMYICGGFDIKTKCGSSVVECFNPATQKWNKLNSLNTSRSLSPGVVSLDECLYVLGGKESDSTVLDSVELYDRDKLVWKFVAPMLTRRSGLGCVAMGGRIYVCGGETVDKLKLATAEVYNPITNQWNFISSMLAPRVCCTLIAFANKLYVIGGTTGKENLKSVEKYDPQINEWTLGQSKECNNSFAAVI